MSHASSIAGSFRDPAGRVFDHNGRILRTVTKAGRSAFDAARTSGLLDRLVEQERLLQFTICDDPDLAQLFQDAEYVLEHPRIEFISHPYEWSFGQLRAAALLHLDIALTSLGAGFVLSDATAFNIQFIGSRPVFIDHLSFRPYREREFWLAHSQFCDQFLNPLLLRAELGIPHNAWYRGALEGIPTQQLAKLLPHRTRFSIRKNVHVFLPARFQRGTQKEALSQTDDQRLGRGLPKRGYEGLLRQLRTWIASMMPKDREATVWADYADDNTYKEAEAETKRSVVTEFAARHRPAIILDLGCNTGFFAEAAIAGGASAAVGFDFDQHALDKAFKRAEEKTLPFLSLYFDASNPSPDQGWLQAERAGFESRARADAVSALAFIHHLAIAKNVPLDQVVAWIVDRAPIGLLEFVPKADPTVQSMLKQREDIFDQYTEEAFVAHLSRIASIVNRTEVSAAGRVIYEFERFPGT